ncbi:hypothetical protein [Tenacibaculum xiamenense]|uniref:hypothetical protein n=1 Tax=Tenacibaculum xiamenense TaxID=1261553 RepID=UPI003895C5B2
MTTLTPISIKEELSLQEIIKLASDQFQVDNATETITPVHDIEDVFAPPHHGPKNIPIHATPVDHGDNFTHFPIVNSGTYYLFLKEGENQIEVYDMHYNGPSQQNPPYFHIELEELDSEQLKGSPFKQAFKTTSTVIFNQSDPQPIAIHFSVKDEDVELKYIVVGVNAY